MANKKKFDWLAALIPGYGHYRWIKNQVDNVNKDGFQLSDIFGFLQTTDEPKVSMSTVNDAITQAFNDHGVGQEDVNGHLQVDINSADPTSSASNVIDYDPNKSAAENMLGYAQANNSASAYNTYLQNRWNEEMSNTAISRAIADAEANGISKYQLFQAGNMAASTPSSGSSMYQSYENAMNRRESWNEKELAAFTAIVMGAINAASKMFGK